MLTLYYAKGTAALAPHILLEEAGAEYETRELSFAAQEQGSAGYLAVNPRGRVPALETPQGTLTEVRTKSQPASGDAKPAAPANEDKGGLLGKLGLKK